MAGYWGKMERIVCSYQPLPGSQIAWWGRIIKNEQSENKTRATWERAQWRREKKADLATGRERQLTTGKRAERKLPVLNLPLCHWSSQSFLWTKTWICFKFAKRKYDANLCKLGTTFAQIYSPVCKNLNHGCAEQFWSKSIFSSSVWFARAVENWRSRSVAKSAHCLSPARARFSHFFLLNDFSQPSWSLEQASSYWLPKRSWYFPVILFITL